MGRLTQRYCWHRGAHSRYFVSVCSRVK
jgi:hypothetical protein